MKLPRLRRPPDFIIWQGEEKYLLRWYVIPRNRFFNIYLHKFLRWYVIPRNRFFNIYLHKFLRSDEDRAMHDHPWWSIGMILKGQYYERMPYKPEEYRAGTDRCEHNVLRNAFDPVIRRPGHIHRIILLGQPVWTIFITGPRVREWGFWCPNGFKDWRAFTKEAPGGNTVGVGCDDGR